jgi:hypothetical protein
LTGLTLGASGGGCSMTSCPAAPSPSSASSWDQDGTATTSSAGASTPTRESASSGEPEPSLGWARAASRRRRTDARPRWFGARARRERTSRVVRDADADTIGATLLDFAFGLGASAVVVVFPKRRTCRWRALGALAATRNSRPTPATRARTDMTRRGVFEARRAWSPRATLCAPSPRAARSSVSSSETRARRVVGGTVAHIISRSDDGFHAAIVTLRRSVRRVVTSLPSRFPSPR